MKTPIIKVEIIHIEGPLKGTIQEFYEPLIEIGRHPDCHVCFPKEMNTISRKHLDIRREGNRFLAIDHSTNGTLVNGKAVQEIILKDGDVLTISENGPKLSVLTTILKDDEVPPTSPQPRPEATVVEEEVLGSSVEKEPVDPLFSVEEPTPSLSSSNNHKQDLLQNGALQTIQKSLIIQYGVQIKSFQTLPITIGSGASSDFIIDQQQIAAEHAQVHYHNDSYHIKDLTGRGVITINGRPVSEETPLVADTCVSLSGNGPMFQFLGEGRLAEIATSLDMQNASDNAHIDSSNRAAEGEAKKSFWPFSKK